MSEINDDALLKALGGAVETGPPKAIPGPTRINFGGIKEKPKATGNTEYPQYPDADGKAAKAADRFLTQKDIVEAATAEMECARAEIIELVAPYHWRSQAALATPAGTVSVFSTAAKEVLVQFKNAYKAIADIKDKAGKVLKTAEQCAAAIPPEVFQKYFRESFTLKIDSTKIPEEKLQAVVDKVQTMVADLGLPADSVTVAPCFKPLPTFHLERYKILTPEQNMAIEKGMGEKGLLTIAVTAARGRKK